MEPRVNVLFLNYYLPKNSDVHICVYFTNKIYLKINCDLYIKQKIIQTY